MKKFYGIVLALLLATAARAQTNAPAQFYDSLLQYFTTFNTNLIYTFGSNHHADIYLGMDTIENEKIAASFNADVDVYHGFAINGTVRNDTILGHVFAAQGGVDYQYVIVDTKLSFGADLGYRWERGPYVAPYGEVKKALTLNTFAGTRLELPFYWRGGESVINPTISIFTGFRF